MNSTGDQLTHSRHAVRRASSARALSSFSRVLLFVITLACAAQAQSGRRAPRPQEVAPVPTPSPSPEPKKHETDVTHKINVLVLADTFSSGQSSMTSGIVQESFMQRLRESGSLVVSADSSRTTRGGAQKRAKDEKDSFVVWMTLRYNGSMGTEPVGVRARPQDYSIEYAVYDPVTGRARAGGTVFLRAGYGTIGGVAVGAPSCYPTTYANELEFVYGAIDTANRVMRSLDVPLPPLCGK